MTKNLDRPFLDSLEAVRISGMGVRITMTAEQIGNFCDLIRSADKAVEIYAEMKAEAIIAQRKIRMQVHVICALVLLLAAIVMGARP